MTFLTELESLQQDISLNPKYLTKIHDFEIIDVPGAAFDLRYALSRDVPAHKLTLGGKFRLG